MEHIGRRLAEIEHNIKLNSADPIALHGFTQVPNFILKNPDISIGAKTTYALFLSYAWHNSLCFPGQDTLAKAIGMSIGSVNAFIKELQACGLIEITRRGQGCASAQRRDPRSAPKTSSAVSRRPRRKALKQQAIRSANQLGRVGQDCTPIPGHFCAPIDSLARHIGDKRLLRIVRGFLNAGMMQGGVVIERHEGTPQGGPLSPLLANLLLDDLDKELERRGHRFCRYADDCDIYVRSQAAGERIMASVVAFLEGRLRLRVNVQKSAVAPVWERSFLGHRLLSDGRLGLAPKSLDRAKERLRRITRRNRGIALARMVEEVNSFTTGWVTYFRHAACKGALRDLDEWLRRKLRCVRLKQCKRAKPIADFLVKCGVPEWRAWRLALSGKGWWRVSGSPPAHEAMTQQWLASLGLVSLSAHHAALQPAGNRRVR